MQAANFRPSDREHLRRGVELHGAGAERDHGCGRARGRGLRAGAGSAVISRFGVVRLKHRIESGTGRAAKALGKRRSRPAMRRRERSARCRRSPAAEGRARVSRGLGASWFVERNADAGRQFIVDASSPQLISLQRASRSVLLDADLARDVSKNAAARPCSRGARGPAPDVSGRGAICWAMLLKPAGP